MRKVIFCLLVVVALATFAEAGPVEETAAYIKAILHEFRPTMPDRPPLPTGAQALDVTDAWGQPLALIAQELGVVLASAGPDSKLGTGDDVIGAIIWQEGRWQFDGVAN